MGKNCLRRILITLHCFKSIEKKIYIRLKYTARLLLNIIQHYKNFTRITIFITLLRKSDNILGRINYIFDCNNDI